MAFFVCRRVILCLWAFGASVGVLLRPGLNDVIRALEWQLKAYTPDGEKWQKTGGGWTGGRTKWRDKN